MRATPPPPGCHRLHAALSAAQHRLAVAEAAAVEARQDVLAAQHALARSALANRIVARQLYAAMDAIRDFDPAATHWQFIGGMDGEDAEEGSGAIAAAIVDPLQPTASFRTWVEDGAALEQAARCVELVVPLQPTASFITWVEDATQAPLRGLRAVLPSQALTAAAPHLLRTARRRALTAGSTDEDDSAAADYAEHFAAASAFAAVIYGFNIGAALERAARRVELEDPMLPTASFITWVEDATQAPLRSLCAVIPPQALTAAAPHLRRTARRRALTAGSTDEDDSGAEDPIAAADYAEHFAAASAFAAVIYGFNVGAALEHIRALVCTPSAGGQLARRSVRGSDCDSNRDSSDAGFASRLGDGDRAQKQRRPRRRSRSSVMALALERDAVAAFGALAALPPMEFHPLLRSANRLATKRVTLLLSEFGIELVVPHRVRRTSHVRRPWSDLSGVFLRSDCALCVSYVSERDAIFTSPFAAQIASHMNERMRLAHAVKRHDECVRVSSASLATAAAVAVAMGDATVAGGETSGASSAGPSSLRSPYERGSKLQRFFGESSGKRLDVEVRLALFAKTTREGRLRLRFLEQLKRVESVPQTVLDLTKQFLSRMTTHLATKMQVAESPTQTSRVRIAVEEATFLPIENLIERSVAAVLRVEDAADSSSSSSSSSNAGRVGKLRSGVKAMRGLPQARFDIPLGSRDRLRMRNSGNGGGGPWGRAIVELRGMDAERLPSRKLERLLAAVAAVCDTASEAATATVEKEDSAVVTVGGALGADDLLPILTFLIVHSDLKCAAHTSMMLVSLCNLHGESAYYHTLFDSAISVVAERLFDDAERLE